MSVKKKVVDLEDFFPSPNQRFINRELSWLSFNQRVIDEAKNLDHPLLERVKFLAISASNFNEFYMVRVAGLQDQIARGVNNKSHDGLTVKEQLQEIYQKGNQLKDIQQECVCNLKSELKKENIIISDSKDLSMFEAKFLKNYFLNDIFPTLSPITVDSAHPMPFLPNLGLSLILRFENEKTDNLPFTIILLPANIKRLIKIKAEKDSDNKFILLEDVIKMFASDIFPDRKLKDFGLIHVIRDSDIEIDDGAEDLVATFENAVKQRRRGNVIHLNVSPDLPDEVQQFLVEEFSLKENEIFEVKEMLSPNHLMELYSIDKNDLKFKYYEERFPERINDFEGNYFSAIENKDFVIHHPYESFDVVVNFLEQAARDKDVVAIKQTLYRTSSDSPIVSALIKAAEAGKSVTVVVELKARFDEEANIQWAKNLERAGAQVVFGFIELKTHAKISLVARRVNDSLKTYVHFGTGNYHPQTARVYSDLSFFTCNKELCHDASLVFNYLTSYAKPKKFSKVFISPINMKKKLLSLIDNEIYHSLNNRPANIWAKMNALVDPDIIDALYEASQNGVKIELIIRGICVLRPQIEGFSDNITVKTIVGRFLEHSRISCFGDGNLLPSKNAKLFITSADWMPRNLDNRVEIMVPVENETVHEQIMGQILGANIKDKKQSWIMQSDGSYKRCSYNSNSFSAHEYFINNPSLSGRGNSLNKAQSQIQRNKLYEQ